MPMASAARTIYKPTSVRIPKGLTIRRQGEFLETVSSKACDVSLLSTHPQLEVSEVTLRRDSRLVLTPAGSATETFYVLSGRISCELPSGPYLIDADDYIITQELKEPTILTALTDACLIYITTYPQFHTFSEHLSQLRQLAVEVELKDGYTANHCERLQELSFVTGKELGLAASRLHLLEFGAYLHDVGKIRVPVSILNKPAKLSPDEWSIIKQHPTFGREFLDNTFMSEAGKIVEQHHERIDGSGYPFGLLGDEVLIEASIVAVADTYDAMTTDRPYRRALSQEAALSELKKYSGIHYPHEVVRAFVAALKGREGRF
jgi:HD-GYP domain-containing protein (c-di-GMP phosphodiesterase class II)